MRRARKRLIDHTKLLGFGVSHADENLRTKRMLLLTEFVSILLPSYYPSSEPLF